MHKNYALNKHINNRKVIDDFSRQKDFRKIKLKKQNAVECMQTIIIHNLIISL